MYGNYSYPINGNVQQNLAQQRMNNLQSQYNQMFSQQEMMQQQVPQQMQMIKGRPVSSLEEARAMQTYSNVRTTDREKEQKAEEIYLKLDEHMQKALGMHEQLADYFCFLGCRDLSVS